MSSTNGASGARLLVATLHEIAQADPSRIWASVPVDDGDLTKGFRDIHYAYLLNAVSHATHWLQETLYLGHHFETIAYAGPKDLRYPILALAAAHVKKKLLLPSPFVSRSALAHLIRSSDCRVFLHDGSLEATILDATSTDNIDIKMVKVPSLDSWLRDEEAVPVQWTESWDQAKSYPWIIFHTSGTTGTPRLVTYTHELMSSLDVAELMEDAQGEVSNRHYGDGRWYTPLPTLHFVGMTISLQFPVFLGATLVIAPTTPGPIPPNLAGDVLRYGKVRGAMMPPSLIEAIASTPAGLESLKGLDYLYFAGAPLKTETSQKLRGFLKLKPGMGSTEAGAYFLGVDDDDDWEWYRFRPCMGMELKLVSDRLYEAVFRRHPDLDRWQQVFKLYPDLQSFPTKDLFVPHPQKPGKWKYAGRSDDLIIFAHGEDLVASELESEIASHPKVGGALVGGNNQTKPFLIVQWANDDDLNEEERLDLLWPAMESINEKCSDLVKFTRELTLFTRPGKELIRTTKGEVSRKINEENYHEEIAALYA